MTKHLTEILKRLEELLEVVQEAGNSVLDVYNSNSAIVQTKIDDTPVTQADLASHEILTSGLKRLFPSIPIVSEEGNLADNHRIVKSERFWLIDPLDGTKEFIARSKHFTICVALIESDTPCFGIVSAPALGDTYYGGRELGSYKRTGLGETTPIRVTKNKLGVVLGSRSAYNEQTRVYIDEHYPGVEIQAVGSQLKLPCVAEGKADAYPRIGSTLHLWDLAAGQAILEGAGGSVRKPDGSPINYHADNLQVGDFVASS
ncbi:3'(2'),5'-bisphosphate nucleotidase CysQ [soil metagenome]